MKLPPDRRARILAACGGDKTQAKLVEADVTRAIEARMVNGSAQARRLLGLERGRKR